MYNHNKESILKCIRFIEDGNSVAQDGSGQLINRAVISHIADIQNISLDLLAEDTRLSIASVSRYFKKNGFSSFASFRNTFARFVMEQQIAVIKNSVSSNSEKDSVNRQIEDFCTEFMKKSGCSYTKAAEIMSRCDHVLFSGEMYELHPFFPLQVLLICSSTAAYLCRTSQLKEFPYRILKGNVAIVAVSHSQENAENILHLKDQIDDAKIISFGKYSELHADTVIPSAEQNTFHDCSIITSLQVKCLMEEYIKVCGMSELH